MDRKQAIGGRIHKVGVAAIMLKNRSVRGASNEDPDC